MGRAGLVLLVLVLLPPVLLVRAGVLACFLDMPMC